MQWGGFSRHIDVEVYCKELSKHFVCIAGRNVHSHMEKYSLYPSRYLSETPANGTCAWSKSRNISFDFAKNCHGNAATVMCHNKSKSSRLVDGFTIIPAAFHGSKQSKELAVAQQRLTASSRACTESSHVPAGGTKIREQIFSRSSVIHPLELLLSDVTIVAHKTSMSFGKRKNVFFSAF